MLRPSPGVGYAPAMHRPVVIQAAALLLLCTACESNQTELAKQLLGEAARQTEKSVEQAARQAEKSVEKGVAQARRGIGEARQHYDVDARVAEARKQFGAGMDEAAASFTEFADASRTQAKDIGAAFNEKSAAGIKGAAEAISCTPDPDDNAISRCSVGQELLAKLREQPKLLANEIMLLPKRGETGQGLQLIRLRPDGVSDLLGFSRSDILLELNGISLGSLEAIRSIDEALANTYAAKLVFERDGERKTVVIQPETTPKSAATKP